MTVSYSLGVQRGHPTALRLHTSRFIASGSPPQRHLSHCHPDNTLRERLTVLSIRCSLTDFNSGRGLRRMLRTTRNVASMREINIATFLTRTNIQTSRDNRTSSPILITRKQFLDESPSFRSELGPNTFGSRMRLRLSASGRAPKNRDV